MKSDAGGTGNMGLDIALDEALDTDGDEVDPSARALMRKQVRMLDLQMKHLRRETREQGVKFLRERLHAAFELAIALGVLTLVVIAAGFLWRASQAEGLVIKAFTVPPAMATRGMTGPVLAGRLSDSLGEIEAITSSVRAGGAIRATQHQEIKVEIPETTISISDVDALLRSWLGAETIVSGELVQDEGRISLTVRVGDRPGTTLYGAPAELDQLIRRAAEQVLAQTEPYRYAVYLSAQNKQDEALTVAEGLALNGSPTDRAWGFTMWSRLLASRGDFAGAAAKARRSLELDPNIAATHDNLAAAHRVLGWDQQALTASQAALAAMRRERRSMDKISGPSRLATAEGRVQEARGDFGAAAESYARAMRIGGLSRAAQAASSLPRVLALDHDIVGARQALEDLRGNIPEDAIIDAAMAPGLVEIQAGNWVAAERLLRKAEMTALMFGDAGLVVRRTQIAPNLAYVMAMRGDLEGARTMIVASPTDCYLCARVRAMIAGLSGDRRGAENAFRAAVALAPTLPAGYLDWARMRLAAGDVDGAIAQARKAASLAPAWSDPLVVWGEALARKGDRNAAAQRFAAAAVLSPRWGLPLLRQAQMLKAQGREEQAERLLVAARKLSLTTAQIAELKAARRRASS